MCTIVTVKDTFGRNKHLLTSGKPGSCCDLVQIRHNNIFPASSVLRLMEWLTLILLFAVLCEIYADYCGESTFCHSPYKCCETKRGCCYDSMLYSSKHIHPQIWNMWYFWFLLIFIMMSCFGGCGYYRRRRIAILTRISDNIAPVRPVPVERNSDRSTEESTNRFTYFAYNGPGLNSSEPDANLPPPYAEVVSQPQLYPVNKMGLPPYPGYDKQDDNDFAPHGSTVAADEARLPPPYSECSYDQMQPPLLLDQDSIPSQCLPSQSGDLEQPAAVPSINDSKAR